MPAEDRVFFTFVAVILVVLSFFIGFVRGVMERDSALKAGAARYYLDASNEKKFEYLGTK